MSNDDVSEEEQGNRSGLITRVAVCCSGGGQRAAVAAGAAMLALESLERRGEVVVDSWSATSGSSLFTALALTEPDRDESNRVDVRSVLQRLCQAGFAPAHIHPPYVLVAILATALSWQVPPLLGSEPPSDTVLPLFMVLGTVVLYALCMRIAAISFVRGRNRWWQFARRWKAPNVVRQSERPPCENLGFRNLIGEGRLQFSATNLDSEHNELVWLDPGTAPGGVIDSARASAAFPLVVGPGIVDGRRYADGGLRSNTSLERVISRPAGHDVVLSVDATARNVRRPTAVRWRPWCTKLGFPWVPHGFLILAMLVGLGVTIQLIMDESVLRVLVQQLLWLLLIGRFMVGVMREGGRDILRGVAGEAGQVDVLLDQQRVHEIRQLENMESDIRFVGIGRGGQLEGGEVDLDRFDFPTTLSKLGSPATKQILTACFSETLQQLCSNCQIDRRCPACASEVLLHAEWVDRACPNPANNSFGRVRAAAARVAGWVLVARPGRHAAQWSFMTLPPEHA